ncbi:unnamed protein product [Thlaspi arvense]|uniref:Uncharacterized protein n=1 Tax=Thlaspi arvense TaxID=13288 RepID=A0AAU9RS89_THLAR|nr:unnamed protein product [Thlaspi arvense]
MGEQEEGGKKKRVVVESLGWLTESSIMPKKHRAIAGVGASSILELKASSTSRKKSPNVPRNSPTPPTRSDTSAPRKKLPLETLSLSRIPAWRLVLLSTPLMIII